MSEEMYVQLPTKLCPECRSRVAVIPDIPCIWVGYCKSCKKICKFSDEERKIHVFLKEEERGDLT
jgi:hypothetical protein